MPLRGTNHSDKVRNDAPFFKELAELDEWASKRSSARLSGVVDYQPRKQTEGASGSSGRGKLLVCHDYKGGYTETPAGFAYTFNFWSLCDTYIYFSHHRVSVPPPGWINAAHRQGVKMLGTLIFEGSSGQQDCLRLLIGRLPQSKTGLAEPSADTSFPISSHYARLLAELAYLRGFDGYLLNFECPLVGKVEQARALTAWIAILESELKHQVGPYAQAIWYDSVIVTGDLAWQDRLNTYNLPFYVPSSAFFTNYTWPAQYPSRTAEYYLGLDPQLTISCSKLLNDIHVGVDVWGRGQHGGGGFGSYRAINHIDPEFLGLSVALFGQAWTWETKQDEPGFSWEVWWDYERKLWVGPPKANDVVEVPPQKYKEGEPRCDHGPFVPLRSFFLRLPPPNPSDFPFVTWFSPGVGRAWFVRGNKVLQTEAGWTDLDKTTSLGDMVWPHPSVQWEDSDRTEPLPECSSSLRMDDAWLGGSSLDLSFSVLGSEAEDAFFRCLWVPIQSLAITPGKSYEFTVIYKIESDNPVDFDLGLSVKSLVANTTQDVDITPLPTLTSPDIPHGWTRLAIRFIIPGARDADTLAAAGLVVGFATDNPTQTVQISLRLGALGVYPGVSFGSTINQPKLLWADFQKESSRNVSSPLSGTLVWDTAVSLGPLGNISISADREDPRPSWKLDSYIPSFAFFNVYVQFSPPDQSPGNPQDSIFIGTTGLSGIRDSFYVDPACLPSSVKGVASVRFYVQGVTDRGDVLEWDRCVYVDVHNS